MNACNLLKRPILYKHVPFSPFYLKKKTFTNSAECSFMPIQFTFSGYETVKCCRVMWQTKCSSLLLLCLGEAKKVSSFLHVQYFHTQTCEKREAMRERVFYRKHRGLGSFTINVLLGFVVAMTIWLLF